MNIPDEAVEAAAKAIHEASGWLWKDPDGRREASSIWAARSALQAAASHIGASAWEDGYSTGHAQASYGLISDHPNPYRGRL